MITKLLIRFLCKVALHTFFGEVDVVGMDNLSKRGPVIIVGNHKNQFVDALLVVAVVDRNVSFLVAEKSMHRRIIGDFARAMNSIPVIRAQDRARASNGKIISFSPNNNVVEGDAACDFLNTVKKGEQLSLKGMKTIAPLQIVEVESSTRVKVKAPVKGEDEPNAGEPAIVAIPPEGLGFKIIPKIDQSEVFGKTFDALCNGQCIGIFPEGGSSDRTDLLPLKAGVSVMALGAADRGAPVQVVPIGLNYSHANRWRSRVLVDVGKAVTVPPELLQRFRDGEKRESYADFLKLVEKGLRGVTFNAPDKKSLSVLRCMRRMYQGDISLPPKRFMELNRRFALAFSKFREDERFLVLLEKISEYMTTLRRLRLSDRQVATFPPVGSVEASFGALMNLMIDILVILFVFIFSVPGLIVFGPMLLRIRYVVQKEVSKALAGSSVKVEAKDVEASQKIMGAFIWVPITVSIWTIIIGGLTGGLWPPVSPYPPGSALDGLFLNAKWIIPISFLVFIVPYGFLCMFMVEFAAKRAIWLNRHFVVARAIFRPHTSTAGRIRSQRKDLALRIQDFVDQFMMPAIPEWREDPIINRETIVDRRRPSDAKRAAEVHLEIKHLVDLEANNPMFSSPIIHDADLRESIRALDEAAVNDMFESHTQDQHHPGNDSSENN